MKAIFLISLLVLLCSAAGFGQAGGSCPTVELTELAANGDTVLVGAVVSGGSKAVKPKYEFTVFGGAKIADGKDPGTAMLDTTGLSEGKPVGVLVQVAGYGYDCRVSARTTVYVRMPRTAAFCPKVRVSAQPQTAAPGKPITFSVAISGGDPNANYTYHWSISAGMIVSGQGTDKITVEETEKLKGTMLKATLDVGGARPQCEAGGTASVAIAAVANILDDDDPKDVGKQGGSLLLLAANLLQFEPDASGVVFVYSGHKTTPRQKAASIELIKKFFRDAKIAARVQVLDGGVRDVAVRETWLVPAGAGPPVPTPTIKPGRK